jgi:hypothetical protein
MDELVFIAQPPNCNSCKDCSINHPELEADASLGTTLAAAGDRRRASKAKIRATSKALFMGDKVEYLVLLTSA